MHGLNLDVRHVCEYVYGVRILMSRLHFPSKHIFCIFSWAHWPYAVLKTIKFVSFSTGKKKFYTIFFKKVELFETLRMLRLDTDLNALNKRIIEIQKLPLKFDSLSIFQKIHSMFLFCIVFVVAFFSCLHFFSLPFVGICLWNHFAWSYEPNWYVIESETRN